MAEPEAGADGAAEPERSFDAEVARVRRRVAVVGAWTILVLATLVAYANTFRSPFVFDDQWTIVTNPLVRRLDVVLAPWREIDLPVTQDHVYALRSRWIPMLTFALNYRIGKLDVRGYHLVNLAIHLIAGLVLWRLVVRLWAVAVPGDSERSRAGPVVAFLVAGFFLLHPIQTQAVTYVVQRMAELAALFCMLGLLAYLEGRCAEAWSARRGWLALAVVSLAAAMWSKQNAWTFPLLVAVAELVFFRASAKRRAALLALPLATMSIVPLQLATISVASYSSGSPYPVLQPPDRLDYLATQTRVVVRYLELLVLPVGQNIDPDVELSRSLFEPKVVASGLFLALLLGASIALLVRREGRDPALRLVGFGGVWFFFALSIESSLVPISDLMFEHRLYLPSAGFFLAVVGSATVLAGARQIRLVVAIGVLACATLAVATHARNEVWRSDLSLWKDAAAKSPRKTRPLYSIAQAWIRRNRAPEAEAALREELAMDARDVGAWTNLGAVQRKLGKVEEARASFERAVALEPKQWVALLNLGDLAWQRKDREAALDFWRRAEALETVSHLARSRIEHASALENGASAVEEESGAQAGETERAPDASH